MTTLMLLKYQILKGVQNVCFAGALACRWVSGTTVGATSEPPPPQPRLSATPLLAPNRSLERTRAPRTPETTPAWRPVAFFHQAADQRRRPLGLTKLDLIPGAGWAGAGSRLGLAPRGFHGSVTAPSPTPAHTPEEVRNRKQVSPM